jgi:hypothetical protein
MIASGHHRGRNSGGFRDVERGAIERGHVMMRGTLVYDGRTQLAARAQDGNPHLTHVPISSRRS